MIYGWGTQSVERKMADGKTAVCRYRYVSLMFIVRFVWERRWFLTGYDRREDREVSHDELAELYGARNVPTPSIWKRFGIFLVIGAGVAVALILALIGLLFGPDDDELAVNTGEPVAEFAGDNAGAGDGDRDATTGTSSGERLGADESGIDTATQPDDESAMAEPEPENNKLRDRAAPPPRPDTDDAASTDAKPADGDTQPADGATSEDHADAEPAGAAEPVFESAEVTQLSSSNLATPNVANPNQGSGLITVDRSFATDTFRDASADQAAKFLVVEGRYLGMNNTVNLQKSSFRLIVDGVATSPIAGPNEAIDAGEVWNDIVVFMIDEHVTTLEFEAGPPSTSGEGLTARFELVLSPDPAAMAHLVAQRAVPTSEIEQAAPAVKLTSGTGAFSPNMRNPNQGTSDLTVLGATASNQYGGTGSGALAKFVIVEVNLVNQGRSVNVQAPAYRLFADDEWYSPVAYINEIASAGEALHFDIVFTVPRTADDLVFEAGVPPEFDEGLTSVYEFTLD